MKVTICVSFLAIACSAVAFPGKTPVNITDELDLTKLVSKKTPYVEPINSAKTIDLPGSRIVGGAELIPHAAPYQAALIVNGNFLCGGSLITSTRVLSTAYCNQGASYVLVRLGAHRFNEEEDTQVRITSTSIIIHESYDVDGGRANDIAIIVLPTQVTLNDYVKVVSLAPSYADTYEGFLALVSGWGTTTDASSVLAPALRGVYVRVMSNADCSSIYGADVVLDSKMCTFGTGIVGICSSDSGNPLVENGMQIGIAAFNGQCELGLPSGYTRVSSFSSWIEMYADL